MFDQMLPEGAMLRRVEGADEVGLQVMIHAIGDEANLRILDIYRQAAEKNGPRDRRRCLSVLTVSRTSSSLPICSPTSPIL